MIKNTDKTAAMGRRDVLKTAGAGVIALAGACLLSRGAHATPEAAAE